MTKQLKELLQPLLGLVVITAFFVVLSPTFRQPAALRDVLEQSTVLLIMATGTTIMIRSGDGPQTPARSWLVGLGRALHPTPSKCRMVPAVPTA